MAHETGRKKYNVSLEADEIRMLNAPILAMKPNDDVDREIRAVIFSKLSETGVV